MTTSKQRAHRLRRVILEELTNTPRGYMQPQEAIENSTRLSLCPAPTDAELDDAFRYLEADALIHREVDRLGVKRWCITSLGHSALEE